MLQQFNRSAGTACKGTVVVEVDYVNKVELSVACNELKKTKSGVLITAK